jgi:hypothetical protein
MIPRSELLGSAGLTDLATAIFPTGSLSTDPDGVSRYTLSDDDVRKVRSALTGILPDPTSSTGLPLFRVSRLDEAVVPAVLEKYGIFLAGGAVALLALGYFAARRNP